MSPINEARFFGLGSVFFGIFSVVTYKWHEMPSYATNGAIFVTVCFAIISFWISLPARLKSKGGILYQFLPWSLIIFGPAMGAFWLWVTRPIDLANGNAPAASKVPHIAEDARIDLDNNKILFRGRYLNAGGPISIYVAYGVSGVTTLPDVKAPIASSQARMGIQQRIKIGNVLRYDRQEPFDIMLASILPYDSPQFVLQWEQTTQDKLKVGISNNANYFGVIIIVTSDGSEDKYPFLILCRGGAQPPAIIYGPEIVTGYVGLISDH